MREIKFRAFDEGRITFCPIGTNYGLHRFFGILNDEALIMQYTGLKDKNGNEIYEGDILKIINGWNDNEYITNVRYESNGFCIDVQGFDYNVTPLGYLDEECIVQVIGNIHENPELLCTSQST